MNPEVFKTYRTAMRCLAWTAAVAIAAAALIAGTYINVRWGGPYTISMAPDGPDEAPDLPPLIPKTEKGAEKGGSI